MKLLSCASSSRAIWTGGPRQYHLAVGYKIRLPTLLANPPIPWRLLIPTQEVPLTLGVLRFINGCRRSLIKYAGSGTMAQQWGLAQPKLFPRARQIPPILQ